MSGSGNVRALAARLARVRLVSPERDLVERLDLLEVASGTLRRAATSAPCEDAAGRLARALGRACRGVLEHGVRVVPDDRAAILLGAGAPRFLVAAIAGRPQPLALAVSWRKGERPPPATIARVRLGPFLGYPRCCVAFEEARRASLVLAEGEGMLETWGARTEGQVLAAIDARRPFLALDVGEDEKVSRIRRFPFTSFVACPRCCERGARSPAGRRDARRRELAREAGGERLVRAVERLRGPTTPGELA